MSDDAKVLTGLMERRALEAEIARLAKVTDQEEQLDQARRIAAHGESVLPALVAALDTGDPQLRGGLGQLAAMLDRDQVVAALRSVARERSKSDQARLTALTILDRYLDEEVEQELLDGLSDQGSVVQRSLRELSEAMARDPLAVVEYVQQLELQPPEVARMILDGISQAPAGDHSVALLRMLAQGEDVALRRTAIDQLSRTKSPDAACALSTLAGVLAPSEAPLAERGLRKLQLRGFAAPKPEAAEWRALMSPIDGDGSQVLLLIRQVPGAERAMVIHLLMQDPNGILACGAVEAPLDGLPKRGGAHLLPVGSGRELLLLEAPVGAAWQSLREAAAMHASSQQPTPLAYRFVNQWIWPATQGAEEPPEAMEQAELPAEATSALLDHPLFYGWHWQQEPDKVRESAAAGRAGASRADLVTQIAREADLSLIASYARRLRKMSWWLNWLGQPQVARLAASGVRELETVSPEQSPFLRRLIENALEKAVPQEPDRLTETTRIG